MKTSKIIRALIIILVLTLTLFVAVPEKSIEALSLDEIFDEIIENPDSITQIALPLHNSETSNKQKALNEIREKYKEETGVDFGEEFKDTAGNKYVVLIDKNPTLSTTGLGDVNLDRMVELSGKDSFTFKTGAYTYVVAKISADGGQTVINPSSLSIGVIIAGVYNKVELEVVGLEENEANKPILDSEFALESDEPGVYYIVSGMSYEVIAKEVANYHVTINGSYASRKVFKSNGDATITIKYDKMEGQDHRVRTLLDFNTKVTVGFADYLSNSDIYALLVRNKAGVINLETRETLTGIKPETMFEFRTEDKATGSIVTDLSTLEAGVYEVEARFNGDSQYFFACEPFTFTLEIKKATARLEINSCVVGYDVVSKGGLTKEDLVLLESNTRRPNNVDHVYFTAGLDVINNQITAEVDFTHILSHENAMVQGEIEKQLRLITEQHDPENDGLTVDEFYEYVEALCKLANIRRIDFESARLNEIVDKLSTLGDLANVKINVVMDGERDITPDSYGTYLVGALITDVSYDKTFDVGILNISPEVANIQFEGNDLPAIQIRKYTGKPIALTANAYDIHGELLEGSMEYLYLGVDLEGNKYMSESAPTNKGVYIVIAKFVSRSEDGIPTHIGVGLNVLLIGYINGGNGDAGNPDLPIDPDNPINPDDPIIPDIPDIDPEDIFSKFEIFTKLSYLMKVFNSVEGFDYNLSALLGMFDEDNIASLFERITNFINADDNLSSALGFVDDKLGFDSIDKIKDIITRLYTEVDERIVDVEFDSKELSVYEYTGAPITLTAHAYDEDGNRLNGTIKYYYTGYQVNGHHYISTSAPTLPGVYVVNAVYFELSNGIRRIEHGKASKAFTITTKDVFFELDGKDLADVEFEYDGNAKGLDVTAKYSNGKPATDGTIRVVYMDKYGNASFGAPYLPGKYTAVAFYAEKDGEAAQYFGYKIVTITITGELPEFEAEVDDSDVVDCYDGQEHFKEAILTEGFNNVTVVVDSKNNVKVFVSDAWLNTTLTGSVEEVKAQLLETLKDLKSSIDNPVYNELYNKVEELLNLLTINTLEVNGKKLIEIDTYKVYVFGYKDLYKLAEVEYTHKIAAHVEVTQVVKNTCTQGGYTVHSCSVCGKELRRDNFTEALGHMYANPVFNWNGIDCKTATFTCLYDEKHTSTENVTVEKVVITEPTCTEKGSYTYKATVVFEKKEYTSTLDKVFEEPALGHKHEAVVTEPTCTEQGYTTYTCSLCGNSYVSDYTDALGHNYEGVVTEPTCTSEGYTTYTCSVCGHSYKDNTVAKLDHDFVLISEKDATCISQGEYIYECSVCGETKTDYTSALGHEYVKVEVIWTHIVTRSVVDYKAELVYKCTHDESHTGKVEGIVTIKETVDPANGKPGYVMYEATFPVVEGTSFEAETHSVPLICETHSYVEEVIVAPTCTKAGEAINRCSVCGHSYTFVKEVVPHTYNINYVFTDNYTKAIATAVCSSCGDTITEETANITHKTLDEATCKEFGHVEHTAKFENKVFNDYVETEIIDKLDHSYKEEITLQPTCGTNGVKTFTCICGDSYTEEIPATGAHDYVGVITKQPTVTEKGEKTFTCTVCGHSYKEELPTANEHSWDNGVITKEATCGENGVKTYTCSVCGETKTEIILATGNHNYVGVVTKEATCKELGEMTYTCSVCGHSYTEKIKLAAHSYTDKIVAPTCTEQGYTIQTCSVCGEEIIGNYVSAKGHNFKVEYKWEHIDATAEPTYAATLYYECLVCGEKGNVEANNVTYVIVDPANGQPGSITYEASFPLVNGYEFEKTTHTIELLCEVHNYNKVITTAPTCTTEGKATYTCIVCGHSYEAIESATGHHYNISYEFADDYLTATANAECDKCDSVITEIVDTIHETIDTPSCSKEGHVKHIARFTNDIFNEQFKIQTIGTLNHSYTVLVEKVDETCTENGHVIYECEHGCHTTQTIILPSLGGHKYELVDSKDRTCTETGYNKYRCSVCGDEYTNTFPALGHAYEAVVTAPTCVDEGYTTFTCSVCGDNYTADIKPATGHHYDYENGIVIEEPTCTQDGSIKYTCLDCGHELTNPLSKLGHNYDYDNPIVIEEATCTKEGLIHYLCKNGCGEPAEKTTDKLPHDYSYYHGIEKATCIARGYEYNECICGDIKIVENSTIPALGHDFIINVDKLPTEENKVGIYTQTCQRCGHTAESGFVFDEDSLIKDNDLSYPATCEENGRDVYHATIDGTQYTFFVTIIHLGHDMEHKVIKTPTCTEPGEEIEYCKNNCGKSNTTYPVALGHKYNDGVVTEPTCTEKGYTTYTCSRCQGSSVRDYVDAKGHSYSDYVIQIAPTCMQEGLEVKTCNICSHSEDRTIDKVPHKTVVVKVNEPTCTEKGYTVYECEFGCGYTYNDNYVDAKGHSYDEGKITLEPTCTEKGIKTFTCHCGDSYTEKVDPTGHKLIHHPDKPATCDEAGYENYVTCENCDYVEIHELDALGHLYDLTNTKLNVISDALNQERATVTGTIICIRCNDYSVNETVEGTLVERKEATKEENGYIKFSATFSHKLTVTLTHYLYYSEPECNHPSFNEEILLPPSCTTKGTKQITCKTCGFSTTVVIDELGHKEQVLPYEAPTCDKTGLEEGIKCSVCDIIIKEQIVIPALGHNYINPTYVWEGYNIVKASAVCSHDANHVLEEEVQTTYTVVTPATCIEKGEGKYTATFNSKVFTSQFKPSDIDALGHDYKPEVIAPTCREQGYTTYTCTRCGDTYTADYTDVVEHDYRRTNIVPATCTEDGYIVFKCYYGCGIDKKETNLNDLAKGHIYTEKITTPAKCTEKGIKTFTCHCGDSYTEEIPETGHDYVPTYVPATCTEQGYTVKICSYCNDSKIVDYTDALGHIKSTVITTPATCTTTGVKTTTCSRCDLHVEEVIDPNGHKFTVTTVAPTCEDQGYDYYDCDNCDFCDKKNFVAVLGHEWTSLNLIEATCTVDGIETFICSHDATHTYSVPIYAQGHDEVSTVIAPTCTEKGYTLHECTKCDYEYPTNYTDALGHSYGEWSYHKFPTDVESGKLKQTCSVCDHVNYKDVAPLGQIYNGIVQINEGANGIGTVLDEDMIAAIEASQYSGVTKITLVHLNNVKLDSVELAHEYLVKLLEANLTLAFEVNNLSVGLDAKAIEAIKDQANSENPVSFGFGEIGLADLTSEQQKALKYENYVMVIRLEIASGDQLISDLRGGSANVAIPFTPQSGFEIENYKVVYVATDGKLEDIDTEYVGGKLVMNLSHFSEYSVINTVDTDFIFWMFIITIILLLVIIVSLITLCVLISRKKDTHTVERIVEKVVEVPVTSTASSTETSVEEDEEDDIDLEVDDDDEDETLTEVQPDVMVAVESEQPEMVTSYIYSFRAKLIVSNEDIKDRYFGIIDAINSYKKVKVSESFKRLRVYSGRKTYAQLVFVGKTLCLAMNLNYDDFKDKYHLLDVSGKKKFAETPVMIKLTSNRKVKQATQLLEVLFEGFKRIEVESSKEKIPTLGLKALMNRGLVKSRLTKKRF